MKSSNMAHHQGHAFSSWFSVFVVSHKPVLSTQPIPKEHTEDYDMKEINYSRKIRRRLFIKQP